YNRNNIGYATQLGEEDVWRVIQDVQQTCHIDANRLYLTGHSMGGGGTLHLGLLHTDRFAAIAAVSTWSDLSHAENALNLPVKLCHGAADPLFSVELPRAFFKRLRELGYRVEYEEYQGVGHNAGDQAYREGCIFSWFSQFVRDPYPRRVLHTTANPTRY
ncbi:MAG: phospholipase, partial [Candidatus Latescibacteria bacterium]|nr:phospholipase [Candidatus Latescibacterota bacterium]